jgi:hypothetical protein
MLPNHTTFPSFELRNYLRREGIARERTTRFRSIIETEIPHENEVSGSSTDTTTAKHFRHRNHSPGPNTDVNGIYRHRIQQLRQRRQSGQTCRHRKIHASDAETVAEGIVSVTKRYPYDD